MPASFFLNLDVHKMGFNIYGYIQLPTNNPFTNISFTYFGDTNTN